MIFEGFLPLALQAIVDGVLVGFLYALITLGLQLIFGVLDIINLAHGDFLMLAMFLSYTFALVLSIEISSTFLLTLPILFLIGIGIYYSVINPLVDRKPIMQFAATMGLSMLLPSIAQVIWGTEPKAPPSSLISGIIHLGEVTVLSTRLIAGLTGVIVLIIFYLFMNKTYIGLAIRAVPDDKEAAALIGINIKNVYSLTFALGIALVAIPGAFLMTFQNVFPTIGARYNLLIWCVAILAGLGSFKGLIFSGIIIGIIESLIASLWDPRAAPLGIYLTFLLVLWVRPTGLFGRR